MSERLLRVSEIVERLGSNESWVRRSINSGVVPSVKLGGIVGVLESDLDAWLLANRTGGDEAAA